jgi:hypothetical protein
MRGVCGPWGAKSSQHKTQRGIAITCDLGIANSLEVPDDKAKIMTSQRVLFAIVLATILASVFGSGGFCFDNDAIGEDCSNSYDHVCAFRKFLANFLEN